MAHTNGMLPVPRPTPERHWWESAKRIPRPPEPDLALSPAGHDPRRRRLWRTRSFEIPGKPLSPANGQYSIDRDGYAILTTAGQPVGTLKDDQGKILLAEDGHSILTAIDIPTRVSPFAFLAFMLLCAMASTAVRLLPPLTVSADEVDDALGRIAAVLG